MSFEDMLQQPFGGVLIEAYLVFTANKYYFFCNQPEDVNAGYIDILKASEVVRGKVMIGGDPDKAQVELTFSAQNEIARELMNLPVDDFFSEVYIQQFFLGDPDIDNSKSIFSIFSGSIVGGTIVQDTIKIRLASDTIALRQNGLQPCFSYSCRHALYGPRCKANINNHKTPQQVQSISGRTITFKNPVAGLHNYIGGVAISNNKRRSIIDFIEPNKVVLFDNFFHAITPNSWVDLAMGCDRSIETCSSVFNNSINFGGFPWIPYRNPAFSNIFI